MIRLLVIICLFPLAALAERVINFGSSPARQAGVVQVTNDTAATDGVAYLAPRGVSGGVSFGYTWETMGIFEAKFRLKVADNTIDDVVATIHYTCETTRFNTLPKEVTEFRKTELKGTDFDAPDAYQEFTIRWLTPGTGRNGYQVHAKGLTDVTFDTIRTHRVRSVTEAEVFGYLPGRKDIPTPQPRQGPARIHVVKGFFYDYWLLDMALPRITGAHVTSSSWNSHGHAARSPSTPEQLYQYDLIVLAGTSIDHIPLRQRMAFKTYIKAGGGLLMLGGPQSFGQASLDKSVMGEILPIETTGSFDLKRDKQSLVPHPSQTSHAICSGITFSPAMGTIFHHQASPRDGATVVLGTDEKPLLVTGTHGKGRIATMLFAPMGRDDEFADGETPFWNDPRMPALLANTMRFLITRQDTPPVTTWNPPDKPGSAATKLLDKLDMGALEIGDLDDLEATDDLDSGPKLTPAQIALLKVEGGKPAVTHLLKAIPNQTDANAIRGIAWAVRPHLDASHKAKIDELSSSMHAMNREAAIGLYGQVSPKTPPETFARWLHNDDPLIRRAALRSVCEGHYTQFIPMLKKQHAALKQQVYQLRDQKYEGYWFKGLVQKDPLWSYAEITMALLAMGEPGYLDDTRELLAIMHIQDIKIRSFIFLYNPKVPREAEAAERHRQRNSYVGPDLTQLLGRMRICLGTLPPDLHVEFQQSLLKVDDYEEMLRLLYPAYDLAGHGNADWQAFIPRLEAHTLALALKAKRL